MDFAQIILAVIVLRFIDSVGTFLWRTLQRSTLKKYNRGTSIRWFLKGLSIEECYCIPLLQFICRSCEARVLLDNNPDFDKGLLNSDLESKSL